MFARIHPKLTIYSRIAPLGTPAAPSPELAEIVSDTRKIWWHSRSERAVSRFIAQRGREQTYQGPLAAGEAAD